MTASANGLAAVRPSFSKAGTGRYYPQALITAKGLAKLAEHYGAERQS